MTFNIARLYKKIYISNHSQVNKEKTKQVIYVCIYIFLYLSCEFYCSIIFSKCGLQDFEKEFAKKQEAVERERGGKREKERDM